MGAPGINGTAGDDDLVDGTNAADGIDALAGNDYVRGRGGDDEINGGGGNDILYGEDGVETEGHALEKEGDAVGFGGQKADAGYEDKGLDITRPGVKGEL